MYVMYGLWCVFRPVDQAVFLAPMGGGKTVAKTKLSSIALLFSSHPPLCVVNTAVYTSDRVTTALS